VPEELVGRVLGLVSRLLSKTPKSVYVYRERPNPSEPLRSPYLIAPKRLEDLFLAPRVA
jgi:hypothetical protein